ncbi:Gfo/Idh/MocA family oxidoreductase [Paenibacillus sp. PK4536]|jgi:xylose dehydrogenase (NAD/NADP)|uniref:Trans-1,2-dihydrobenzene-1,2-diol dehydrogenase n=1 Tax=Paenibacillus nuruki TaxID=1886670 RepID=A0A1E3L8V0_9BACL|nr:MULTISPECIES: Gfo/Idh/MocA family oxidoreductase [Paenibacillus]ODP30178.1 Trans-1,2-dihydrobenzene-1,2-diol dehydrogenase [Paenibacillus nuruki]TKJ91684.1 gfo/Idh/MocA family oxidoreductase [Paenibacillus sp. CFBP13512]WIM37920.1 Gfo/Idh/MocA family oxidoreductase [Paenibacillus sp. PK4536]CAJ1315419.1 Trans-1,2-dihydrobenzene-1,2-diol dehydrogenase [Paenibacillus nuruki]
MTERKLKWGIMSTAGIAVSAVIPSIHESLRNETLAIASRSLELAQVVAEQCNIPRAYGSYEELLADPDIDAVYIPLPNHLHKEWTIKSAEAGKHVLCEKPAALDAQEAAEMVDVCRRSGVLFAEGFMYRYHPKHARVRDIIESGEIGTIRSMHGRFTSNNAEDIDNVRYRREMGGGSLYDLGVYPVSAARMYFGSEPVAVTVQGFFSSKHDHVDMMASGLIEFPGSASLTFECGMWAYPSCALEIVGTKGRIKLPYAFGRNDSEDEPQVVIYTDEGKRGENVQVANHFALQVDAFAAAVIDGTPLPYSPEDAIRNTKVIAACLESAKRGEKIRLV